MGDLRRTYRSRWRFVVKTITMPVDTKHTALTNLLGRSESFLRALALIERMARFDAPVLIQGETGTGKELAARAIHYLSPRSDAPFVALNCGAVPETLIESELFGCERGAYTDARQARAGLIAAADGGTLFFDEIDALPLRAQVSLLRFLQERTYRPVGGTREHGCNVRIIAAASPRLQEMLCAGAFRDDLAFRLNVLLLEMPPLRCRPGDPLLLARHFIGRHARHYGLPPRYFDPHSVDWLESYAWPGNVRELDNVVQRALLLSDAEAPQLSVGTALMAAGTAGQLAHLARPADSHSALAGLPAFNDARAQALHRFEREYLERVMTTAAGNVTHAARLAQKERRALGKLLKTHGLDRSAFTAPAPGA